MFKTLLKSIIGKKVERLFIIVWPPYGEDEEKQIDISIGFIFDDKTGEILKISTDKNDLTQPYIELIPQPTIIYNWNNFGPRMKDWMNCNDNLNFGFEFFEVTDVEIFKDIVNQEIKDVQLIGPNYEQIFALKVLFDNDYILSSPIVDGNTIETKTFNKHDNLKNFTSWGMIKYFSLYDIDVVRRK